MIKFFGIDFDPDEREASVRKKIRYIHSSSLQGDRGYSDPYDAITSQLECNDSTRRCIQKLGKIPVEHWLTSKPKIADLVSVENYVFFIDSDGCREYATKVRDFVDDKILPDMPVMIGVDHSSSSGSIEALSKEIGAENLSWIILDSHFDAILTEVRCGLVQYDLETNPESVFKRGDPYIWGRPNSLNADSFVDYLVKNRNVYPENLFVIGVSDHPPRVAQGIKDERVQRFVDSYLDFQKKGSSIVTKESINSKGVNSSIAPALIRIKTPYVYVSLDIDVGAVSAHNGSRYLDVKGLNEEQILLLARLLKQNLNQRGKKLAGLDIMETDVHGAGRVSIDGKKDRTYEIEMEFLRVLLPEP